MAKRALLTMRQYYEGLERLRTHLADKGEERWAQELLDAEAGGSTGNEILVRTGVVLQALRRSGDARRAGLAREVRTAARQCARLWRG